MSTTPVTAVVQEWREIDWATLEVDVHGLQRRIYRASQEGDKDRVHRLQRLVMSSWSAKCIAVRRVTQDNQGKKTPGIDGVASLEPEERLPLVDRLSIEAKPQPARRVWIPKPGSEEMRPLGIPTMYDRAVQALVKLALEPEWEAQFEPNSYGFRPGRSCQDAIAAIQLAIRYQEKFVLDADIAKCFDCIDHKALLDKLRTFPIMRRLIGAWLEAGFFDGDTLFPTKAGTPQGGVISPLLANVALHGLETAITSRYPTNKQVGRSAISWKPIVIRYADDFVILHRDEAVVRECQSFAQEWLKGMSLELKPSKTRIAHTRKVMDEVAGFDFLGFTVRQFSVGKYHSGKRPKGDLLGFKTLIKPSKKKVKLHWRRLAEKVRALKGARQSDLIRTLNPIIRGWCNYYRSVVSSKTFDKLAWRLNRLLFRRWARPRHRDKNSSWIKRKYWRSGTREFATPKGTALHWHWHTKIRRHVKVVGAKSPFDGDWPYWGARQRYYPGVSYWLASVLKRQQGKCLHCGQRFWPDDLIETHHELDADGKRTGSLVALHRHCHDRVHGPKKAVCPTVKLHDKNRPSEEPCEAKVSSTVLEPSPGERSPGLR